MTFAAMRSGLLSTWSELGSAVGPTGIWAVCGTAIALLIILGLLSWVRK